VVESTILLFSACVAIYSVTNLAPRQYSTAGAHPAEHRRLEDIAALANSNQVADRQHSSDRYIVIVQDDAAVTVDSLIEKLTQTYQKYVEINLEDAYFVKITHKYERSWVVLRSV
jgi:hypothetical protein